MKLSERLKGLTGHELDIHTTIVTEEMNIPFIILDEVGDDYIEVTVFDSKYAHHPKEHKIINLSYVVDFAHRAGCEKCDIEKKKNPQL